MSQKKIIRLKTPLKSRQQTKLNESTRLQGAEFNQESTIMLVKNVTCSEQLQVTLINQINKLYRQMGKFKRLAEEDSQKREQSFKQNKILKGKIEVLERQNKMFKEMYDLEKDNHERLRKFYELRQKQWLCIVNEHKKILQEYDQNVSKTISNIEMKSDYSYLESMYTNLEEMLSKSFLKDCVDKKEPHFGERRQRRKLRSSLERQDSLSQPKLKLKLNSHKETSFKDTSQIEERRQRTPLKLKHPYQSLRNSQKAPILQKNAQADETFDSIVRKTYYRYKQKCISIYQIEQLEDMVKLKNAKTSTKERLAKTIRKLDFQVGSQHQLKILCQCVQKAIMQKYKMLRGDYAFDFLVDKLKQCEKLALSSNSQLQRLDKNKSQMTIQESEIRTKCLYNDISAIAKQQSDIYRTSNKSIELLLNSTIKDEKTAQKIPKVVDEDLSEKIKFNGNIRKNSNETHELSGFGNQSKNHLKIYRNNSAGDEISLS